MLLNSIYLNEIIEFAVYKQTAYICSQEIVISYN